jgi:2-polyprenyl-3-methyl-5-hydroxy-6-metoxy-1,4-benzoquinol methylase
MEENTMHQTLALDEKRSEAFADRILETLNHGALGVMISLGHRSGLFDAMEGRAPATSHDLAASAGLDERYVREWLGAMVTGRVVEYDPETRQYALPREHAAWLTRSASPNCLAAYSQYLGLLGSVEDDILHCFRNGGGVPYERFHRFHEVMAEDSGQSVVAALEEHVLPLAPGLAERLHEGIDVLDVGCGSGRALNRMAATFPASRFRGYDLSEEAIEVARREAEAAGLDNVVFEVRDCTHLGETASYDLICTFDAIHDQKEPGKVLAGISEALRPGGLYLMQDIKASSHLHENLDHPLAPFLYTISTMHCMTVSLAQGGHGLGTMWGRQTATRMLVEAGFTNVEIRELEHDPQNDYYLCRREPSESA